MGHVGFACWVLRLLPGQAGRRRGGLGEGWWGGMQEAETRVEKVLEELNLFDAVWMSVEVHVGEQHRVGGWG